MILIDTEGKTLVFLLIFHAYCKINLDYGHGITLRLLYLNFLTLHL